MTINGNVSVGKSPHSLSHAIIKLVFIFAPSWEEFTTW